MKTLREKLMAQQWSPTDPSARHQMKPGEVYLWYMGAWASVDLLVEYCDPEACRALRSEIAATVAELVMDVWRAGQMKVCEIIDDRFERWAKLLLRENAIPLLALGLGQPDDAIFITTLDEMNGKDIELLLDLALVLLRKKRSG